MPERGSPVGSDAAWDEAVPRSIPASDTLFLEDLVYFLLYISCQLLLRECTLSISTMPPEGLPRNSVVRITDRPDMV